MHPIAQALRDLDEPTVNRLIDEELERGTSPLELVTHLNDGMVAVGRLFAEDEYFISQLIFSAEILKGVMLRLEPLLLEGDEAERGGCVVIGTVKGDIHDIGKNIVATLLRGSGFDVVDMGVDVPADKFVEAVREGGAKAVCLSALLNVTYPEMKNVVETFERSGLRDQVEIVIGGAPINEQVREFAGADFYAPDAVAGVELCKKIYG
ncbi:MAG TPA: cobalamin-dependent protein [Thermoleophilia bacterium]|nr:cobalamin-dependent protein [Thermoleophilia bacterium]